MPSFISPRHTKAAFVLALAQQFCTQTGFVNQY